MKTKSTKYLAGYAVIFLSFVSAQFALAAQPGISVKGDVEAFFKGQAVGNQSRLHVVVTHRKHGHIAIGFNGEKQLVTPETVVSSSGVASRTAAARILEGVISARRYGATTTATGAIYKSRNKESVSVLHVPFQIRSLNRTTPKMYDLEFQLFYNHKTEVITHRLRAAAPTKVEDEKHGCGVDTHRKLDVQSPTARRAAHSHAPHNSHARGLNSVMTVHVVIDSRFHKIYGNDSTNALLIAMSRANQAFIKDMGIEIQLSGLTTYTDSATDPVAFEGFGGVGLLEQFSEFAKVHVNGDADLVYLATAERGFSEAIGYAWLATVCANDGYNTGFADYDSRLESFTHTLVHELGHSVGADHDLTDDPTSIMAISADVDYVDLHFSAQSKVEMSTHLAKYNSCLFDTGLGSITSPSSFPVADISEDSSNIRFVTKAKRRKGRVKGKVMLTSREPLPGRVVELIDNDTLEIVATTFTDWRGKYVFKVPYSGWYYTVDRRSYSSSRRAQWVKAKRR